MFAHESQYTLETGQFGVLDSDFVVIVLARVSLQLSGSGTKEAKCHTAVACLLGARYEPSMTARAMALSDSLFDQEGNLPVYSTIQLEFADPFVPSDDVPGIRRQRQRIGC